MALPLSGIMGIMQESAFGVEGSPPAAFDGLIRESLAMRNNLIPGLSRSTMPQYVIPGTVTAGGGISLGFQPEGIVPWLFKGLFGSVSSVQAAPGVFDHSFIAGTTRRLPSFTFRVDDGTTTQLWLGCTVKFAGFTFSGNDAVELNAELVSQRPHAAGGAPATPVYSGISPWAGHHLAFSLNGVTHTDFEQFTLLFENDIEPVFTHNQTRWAARHYLRSFNTAGSVTLRFSSDAERRRLWGAINADQPQRVVQPGTVSLAATHPEEAAPGYNYSFSASFPEIYYESTSEDIVHLPDFILQRIQFTPVSGDSRGSIVDVTIRNSVPGYPDPS